MTRLLVEQADAGLIARLVAPSGPPLMTRQVLQQLGSLFETADARSPAVLITGGASAGFMAGGDLNELRGLDAAAARELATLGTRVFDQIARYPRPVLAALNGDALGAGFLLALACDMRIAVPGARLGYPEIRVGLMPGTGGTDLLVRLAGLAVARSLCLGGGAVDATRARELGLVDEVCSAEALERTALERLRVLADFSPVAYAGTKRALWAAATQSQAEARAAETRAFVECFTAADFEVRVARFFARRPQPKN